MTTPYGRPMLLIAHPGDEAVGATALLGALEGWAVLLLTDGAPRDPRLRALPPLSREAYAATRAAELAASLAEVGLTSADVLELGAVDQEAALELPRLTREVADVLTVLEPRLLLTHAYEGAHPDHDAAAFIAQEACALAAARGRRAPPRLELACDHPSGDSLVTLRFLPGGPRPVEHALSSAERERKRAMLAAHRSQRELLSAVPLERERYRPAPLYDFSQRPHPGPNRAEVLGWPLTGDRFCERAREAALALGISEVTWA